MPGGRCSHNPARPRESNAKGAPEHFPAWRDAEHALTSARACALSAADSDA
jgi:hypothetical protein